MLKSQQEIADFLSAYAERHQLLPTTFTGYRDLLTDNSDEPVVRYLSRSQLGALDAVWILVALFVVPPPILSLTLMIFLPAGALNIGFLPIVLSLAVVFSPLIYSRRQLSKIYRIDTARITHDFNNVLKPPIKAYNSNKDDLFSPRYIRDLVASISSFQEIHPLVPVISHLDRGPVPWGAAQGLDQGAGFLERPAESL